MIINSSDKPSKLQSFLSVLNLICALVFIVAIYLNLRGYIEDLYLNTIFAFMADMIVFTYPLTSFEESLEYTLVFMLRCVVVVCTLAFIGMIIGNISSVTGFTLSLIFTTVKVEYTVLSSLMSVVLGAVTLIVSIIIIAKRRCD